MAVYKDGNRWRVVFRYTNWKGERKQTSKRGFETKKEAVAWEREELLKLNVKMDMLLFSTLIYAPLFTLSYGSKV